VRTVPSTPHFTFKVIRTHLDARRNPQTISTRRTSSGTSRGMSTLLYYSTYLISFHRNQST
jgi:hypothetical protein